MKSFYYIFLIIIGLTISWGAIALSGDDIVFPVAELGDCQNEEECKQYCSDSSHMEECVVFAEQYNLMSQKEIERAKNFEFIGGVGPGGCTNEFECQFYCEDISNIQECITFAEEHGLISDEEISEAKKIIKALEQGVELPGGCTSEQECDAYCGDPLHMKECIEFSQAAGFMSERELKESKQMLKALEAGITPPDCNSKKECDVYCSKPENMEECIDFSIAAGFMTPEEAEGARKMLPLMKAGRMPEWCMDKDECEAYCADETHINECTDFFVEAGFMNPEEAEMFRKTGGKGPGDCKGEEECEVYCNNPDNQEICMEFAREHDLIPQEDLDRMQEGIGKFKEWFSSASPEVVECLRAQVGDEVLAKINEGTFMPNPGLIDSLQQCFEEDMRKKQVIMEQEMARCFALSCQETWDCIGNVSTEAFGWGSEEHAMEDELTERRPPFEAEIRAKDEQCKREREEQDKASQQQIFENEGGGDFKDGEQFFPQDNYEIYPYPENGEWQNNEEGGDYKDGEEFFPQDNYETYPSPEGVDWQNQEQYPNEQEQWNNEEPKDYYEDNSYENQNNDYEFKPLEQFQQLIPEVPYVQQGPSQEEILLIEQQETIEVQQQQQEVQVQQQQIEQEIQQQFQELEQLQNQLQDEQAPPSGSAIDAFLYLLRPLLPR